MNTQPQHVLSDSQKQIVAELVQSYGIEVSEVTFFPDDSRPFLSYEATCAVANQLVDLHDINIEPVESSFVDSLSLKCTLTLPEGRTRSAVGVVNVNETIEGHAMSPQQLYQAASSRAIRNALRAAGIDLLKLHEAAKTGVAYSGSQPNSNYPKLLAQAHALGREIGLITNETKRPWRAFLWKRYGVEHSNDLGEQGLADLVAVLKTLLPARHAA